MSARKEKLIKFLSLKWKILLTLGMMILLLMVIFIFLAFREQMSRFEKNRLVIHNRLLTQAEAQLDNFSSQILKVASLVATIASNVDSDQQFNQRNIQKNRIDSAWVTLQVDYGLESIQVYDAKATLIEHWSTNPLLEQDQDRVRTAIMQEENKTWISCQRVCQQFAVAPILSEGKIAGAVVVSATMVELLMAFNRFADADIGFLLRDQSGESTYLPQLGLRVAGLTNSAHNIAVLKNISVISNLQDMSSIRTQYINQTYDLIFKVLENAQGGDFQAKIVIIDDITESYQLIRRQTQQIIQASAFGSLLILGLIYALLNNPLRRATNAAQAIPLLGEHDFTGVRTKIRLRRHHFLKDEIDVLYESALHLTDHLETLEYEAELHRAEMVEMVKRITLAHEFSERILDTAQVVILTQSESGHLKSINHFGKQFLGWTEGNLLDNLLLISTSSPRSFLEHELLDVFQNIVSGAVNHYYHECVLVCADGSERDFAWHHSRLEGDEIQVLSVGIDITQRKENEAKILYLAEHDQLTGLINRECFLHKIEEILPMIKRFGHRYTLLYLDLDGFKYVNDVSGHQAGDLVLRMVAKELLSVIRADDMLARLGGDELAILLFECDQEGAITVAEKINDQLNAIKFPGLVGEHCISASIGIVELAGDNRSVKQLLCNADIAMYQAKSKRGSRWHIFSEGEQLLEKLQQRLLMEDQIKQALRDQRFIMYYQPILDISNNRISHYEALVRMLKEDGTLVPPIEFIEVAEKTGLIQALDHYVVNLVIRRWAEFVDKDNQLKVAINLSGHSMTDSTLLQRLQELFALYPHLPSRVIFEITETAAVADFSAAREFIETVRGMGCAFSLDDFGVGFSSFYYVKHLPVDYVKLDGSFIRDLADSPDDQVFVRALTEIARGFGKSTVAEFVGNEQALALLREFGVNYAQGFYIGKPSPDLL